MSADAQQSPTPESEQSSDNPQELELIWQLTFDKGRWLVEVRRVGPYKGLHFIFDTQDGNRLISQTLVGIRFDALYGVDVEDEWEWVALAVAEVDSLS